MGPFFHHLILYSAAYTISFNAGLTTFEYVVWKRYSFKTVLNSEYLLVFFYVVSYKRKIYIQTTEKKKRKETKLRGQLAAT